MRRAIRTRISGQFFRFDAMVNSLRWRMMMKCSSERKAKQTKQEDFFLHSFLPLEMFVRQFLNGNVRPHIRHSLDECVE